MGRTDEQRGLSHALDHHAVGELDEAAHSRTTSILGHAVRSPFPEAVPCGIGH